MLNWCSVILYFCAAWVFSFLIYFHNLSYYFSDWVCLKYERIEKEFDYIVVGGGSAGALVAAQLSEHTSVVLLESGYEASSLLFNIPVVAPLLQLSELDWKYHTEPQPRACLALHNNVSRWPMGKVLGGTSKLNSLVYLRGHPRDYDLWSELGNPGWDFEGVAPFFKTSKHLTTSRLRWTTPLAQAFLSAGETLGFRVTDLNQGQQTGFMQAEVNLQGGARWSSEQFTVGDKLKVVTGANVDKVVLKEGYEAAGVQYSKLGKRHSLRARRAVVLSAGVIGSPKLLMLSGIGPAQHLREHKIPVLVDLPVGQNLQDHVTTGLDLVLLNQSLPLTLSSVESPASLWSYIFHGEGPWTFPGCEAVAVLHTNLTDSRKDPPDLQLMLLPTGISSDAGVHLRRAVGVSDEVWSEYFSPLFGRTAVSLLPILLHPGSRGEVLLSSKDPGAPPIINPNYLTHPRDVETLRQGIEFVKQLVATEPLQRLGAQLYDKPLPGCESHLFDSPSYWECYIRHLTLTSFHPAGTCRMGSSGVVDSNLRVRGTHKLFVIDASVMPTLPSANINAAVMMIAQKGAALVQEQWELLQGRCPRRPWYS